ncbi:MAG TPA: thioesterase domain-containing protein, partial [Herpetosiphonaceae bacterium]
LRGFRIELGEIAAALRQHAAVRDAVVLLREDAPGQARLVAYVVAAPGNTGTQEHNAAQRAPAPTGGSAEAGGAGRHADLRAYLQARLPNHLIPAAFVVLDALPLTPNGKLDRHALPAPGATRGADAPSLVAPRNPTELRLAHLWEEVLNIRPIGMTDSFFALGGHSLSAMRLVSRIEQEFQHRLPLAALFQGATVEQVAQMLRGSRDTQDTNLVIGLQPHGERDPFFCVHPVSGDIFSYAALAQALGPDQPFYAIQAAGLEGECPPLTRLEVMAASYIALLRSIQAEGPYFIGGWSVGGIVAFEMARQLRQQGHEVGLLVLLDSVAPAYFQQYSLPEQSDATLIMAFINDLSGLAARAPSMPTAVLEAADKLPPDERVQTLLEHARSAALVPQELGMDRLRQRFEVFQANIRAIQHYLPGPYAGQALLLHTRYSKGVAQSDPTLGWQELIPEGLAVAEVPGDHYSMVLPPHVETLAAALRGWLEQAQQRTDR